MPHFFALLIAFTVFAEQRMIDVGGRKVAVYCDGETTSGSATVILVPAGGRTAKDWASVQPELAKSGRVCSYDHSNFGASDKIAARIQPVDDVAQELHAWIEAAGEQGPFVLVGHSSSGFHIRRFTTLYPPLVSGLVFVDSSHEEQANRLHELDPDGPPLDEIAAQIGFFTRPGQKLEWRTSSPIIVVARGKPFPRTARDGGNSATNRMTDEQFAAWDRIWRELQQDLSKRSAHGQLRIAEKSGHFIQTDEPGVVIRAIRELAQPR